MSNNSLFSRTKKMLSRVKLTYFRCTIHACLQCPRPWHMLFTISGSGVKFLSCYALWFWFYDIVFFYGGQRSALCYHNLWHAPIPTVVVGGDARVQWTNDYQLCCLFFVSLWLKKKNLWRDCKVWNTNTSSCCNRRFLLEDCIWL